MKQIETNLSAFNPIGLDNIKTIKLMKRCDTKFIFHQDKLQEILAYLNQNQEILEIDNKRTFKYETLYYDTDDFYFYNQHHNQRLCRNKIRFRKYADQDKCFFEVKYKSNKKITNKYRILLNNCDLFHGLSDELKKFAQQYIMKDKYNIIDMISPKLRIGYSRITLANRLQKERLTLDLNLEYDNCNTNYYKFNNLVVAELKQEYFSCNSLFFECFKHLRIFPTKFSKYCMGIALTESRVKTNRFKTKLLSIQNYL